MDSTPCRKTPVYYIPLFPFNLSKMGFQVGTVLSATIVGTRAGNSTGSNYVDLVVRVVTISLSAKLSSALDIIYLKSGETGLKKLVVTISPSPKLSSALDIMYQRGVWT